ncbi:MAG: CHAT domain-containing protein [Planctomycetota bacterium]|jgi:CHAT domain-containing protein
MGLAQGGLIAGAKSVLSTLWKVQDESAQRLMVDFYKRLINTKTTRVHALAEAKREAIRQGLPLSTWSAYILWDAETEEIN